MWKQFIKNGDLLVWTFFFRWVCVFSWCIYMKHWMILAQRVKLYLILKVYMFGVLVILLLTKFLSELYKLMCERKKKVLAILYIPGLIIFFLFYLSFSLCLIYLLHNWRGWNCSQVTWHNFKKSKSVKRSVFEIYSRAFVQSQQNNGNQFFEWDKFKSNKSFCETSILYRTFINSSLYR